MKTPTTLICPACSSRNTAGHGRHETVHNGLREAFTSVRPVGRSARRRRVPSAADRETGSSPPDLAKRLSGVDQEPGSPIASAGSQTSSVSGPPTRTSRHPVRLPRSSHPRLSSGRPQRGVTAAQQSAFWRGPTRPPSTPTPNGEPWTGICCNTTSSVHPGPPARYRPCV